MGKGGGGVSETIGGNNNEKKNRNCCKQSHIHEAVWEDVKVGRHCAIKNSKKKCPYCVTESPTPRFQGEIEIVSISLRNLRLQDMFRFIIAELFFKFTTSHIAESGSII